jgi:Type II secretion system (T2SS), protein E, N-terminal domain
MANKTTPLPTLDLALAAAAFEWPQPPFARRGVMAPLPDGPQACRIETLNGSAVEADLLAFEPAPGLARFRVGSGGHPLELPLARFRRLTLTRPWALARRSPDAPLERVPSAAQERDYRIDLPSGGHLVGRSMGQVRNDEGLYLFAPDDSGEAVRRVFVPAAACAMVTFGKSAEEAAMERWVATPEALLRAIEQQRHSRIMSVGDAVIELGFVTRGVVDQVLRRQDAQHSLPLGEMLIAAGHLQREDLQTALAHKMGYPVVDLTRFPIDAAAARLLTLHAMLEHRALPVLRHGERLFVAVDDLARIPRLKALQSLAGLEVVPVLAPRGRLALVLASLPQRMGSDLWANNVPLPTVAAAL